MAANKISLRELVPIMADYRAAFPDWQLARGDILVRFGVLIAQVIWFDRLRTGDYRPTCGVYVLVAPSKEGGTSVLSQVLNIKIREITRQAHAQSLSGAVSALKSEILPSLGKPLDERVVAELLRERAKGRPANAYALACLLAALGRADDAIRWIGEYHSALAGLCLPSQPVDVERDAFLKKVEEWLKFPGRDARFAEVVEQQKSRLLRS